MPTTVRASPTGVKSNIVKLSPVISWRSRETTMLGDVPIWVISPPSSDANAIGIRKADGEALERLANWKAMGIMIASAPMFFTKADRTATTTTSRTSCARTEERFGAKRYTPNSIIPLRATPALTRSALPTIMTMSSLNPLKALSSGTTPTARASRSESAATTSYRKRPQMNAAIITAMTPTERICGHVIGGAPSLLDHQTTQHRRFSLRTCRSPPCVKPSSDRDRSAPPRNRTASAQSRNRVRRRSARRRRCAPPHPSDWRRRRIGRTMRDSSCLLAHWRA